MIITGTSDKIQFKLGAVVTTSQLEFTVSYNNYTSSAVTLLTNNGVSNNTTAVDLVTSPAASQQNQLRYCSIFNKDTANATVIIQVFDGTNTRIVFRAVLSSGSMLQYQLEKGWEVLDQAGNKKNIGLFKFDNGMNFGNSVFRGWGTTQNVTLTATGGIWFAARVGRLGRSYSTIRVNFYVGSPTSGVTYGELGIFTSPVCSVEGTGGFPGIRRGVASIATELQSVGTKSVSVSTSGINPGDIMYIVFSVQASGSAPFISTIGFSDSTPTQSGISIVLSVTGGRPSTVISGPYATAIIAPLNISWQGT